MTDRKPPEGVPDRLWWASRRLPLYFVEVDKGHGWNYEGKRGRLVFRVTVSAKPEFESIAFAALSVLIQPQVNGSTDKSQKPCEVMALATRAPDHERAVWGLFDDAELQLKLMAAELSHQLWGTE